MKKYPHGLTLNAVCDAIDAYREQEDDIPEAGMIAAFEILLSAMDKPETALTAQSVDLSNVDHLLGYKQKWVYMPDVIAAIRAAGYEVQE